MYNYTGIEQYIENYSWQLREIQALEAELKATRRQIDEGMVSRDTYDPNWEQKILDELELVQKNVKHSEDIVNSIPETVEMLPCKLYLRLHMLAGYNLTDTAVQMGVSLSTLTRIRQRCAEYFTDQVL